MIHLDGVPWQTVTDSIHKSCRYHTLLRLIITQSVNKAFYCGRESYNVTMPFFRLLRINITRLLMLFFIEDKTHSVF